MISYLKGKIICKTAKTVTIDVKDVGYEVFVGDKFIGKISVGDEMIFHVYTSVRENAIELYGLNEPNKLEMFKLLLNVQGIGPKSAINLASELSFNDLQNAVLTQNPNILKALYGIGQKTAERITADLKNKFKGVKIEISGLESQDTNDIIDALTGLGYNTKQILEAMKQIAPDVVGTENKIKEALKLLSNNKK